MTPESTDFVILVDSADNEVGIAPKMQVHTEGQLHRAFSVFVFNIKGELLLQKRAQSKYHSGGLWSNTCCSHPRPGEVTEMAAIRRLSEEMGIHCKLVKVFDFTYHVQFVNGLIEHEFDHVYFGFTDDTPFLNENEVERYRYVSLDKIKDEINSDPELFTEWFRMIIDRVIVEKGLLHS